MTTEQKALQLIANMASGTAEIDPLVTLERLGFDSLDSVELALRLSEDFGLPPFTFPDYTPKTTVKEILRDVAKATGAKP